MPARFRFFRFRPPRIRKIGEKKLILQDESLGPYGFRYDVKLSLLRFSYCAVHDFPRALGRGAGHHLAVPEVAPPCPRAVARAGAHLLLRASLLAPPGDRHGAHRPPQILRHRHQPPGDDRHSGPLLPAAQFPLGIQARGVPHPVLRSVPEDPRRHLHRPRPRRRGDGAAARRGPSVVRARRLGGDLSRGHAFEGRHRPPLQGGGFHPGPRGRGRDPARSARRHGVAHPPQQTFPLAQYHYVAGAASRDARTHRRRRPARPGGRGARRDGGGAR